MLEWLRGLDEGQRRFAAALASLTVAVALVTGVVVLGSDDDGEAAVQTEDVDSSTSRASSTTATSSSTSTTVESTSTSSASGAGAVTTTTARAASGGSATTRPPAVTTPKTAPPTTAPPATNPPPRSGPCNNGAGPAAASEMANLFCAHRAGRGLPAMVRTGQLDAMAQEWAAKMANETALSHRDDSEAFAMVLDRCDHCTGWGENVAFSSSVQGSWDDWIASAQHRNNIQDPRDGEYGMGAALGSDGYLYFVHVFGYYG